MRRQDAPAQPRQPAHARIAIDSEAAIAVLDAIAEDEAPWRRIVPELCALAHAPEAYAGVEQEPAALPILGHARRALARKLTGLERGRLEVFQHDAALGHAAFDAARAALARVEAAGLLPCVRAALLFCDFAKGGTPGQRRQWRALPGPEIDLSIHNLAAARILARTGTLARLEPFVRQPGLHQLALALIESHGLSGQHVRGESTLAAFAPLVAFLRRARAQGDDIEPARIIDCVHLVDVCDTAAVREGLLDDRLAGALAATLESIATVAATSDADELCAIEDELMAAEDARWGEDVRSRLVDRLRRLRAGRIAAGEPTGERDGQPHGAIERALAALQSDGRLSNLARRLRTCQLWYAEAATGGLSAGAQLAVLDRALAAADAEPGIDVGRPFHVSLAPLVARLHAGDARTAYRRRLVEAVVGSRGEHASALGTFTETIGGTTAIAVDFAESEEAGALVTLLSIYERKSAAAFHTTLKTLCDLYGLRKDEFDRVANEAAYLVHMNAARSDKARMLDHVRPGLIVEVGPGGGVVLDLLEARFPTADIVGIDVSALVVEALRARQRAEGRRWRLIEADAFALPEHVGAGTVDTVIFCSVLHEIYSYVPPRFSLRSVEAMARAAYAALVPGGRLVIRDGVAPAAGERLLTLIAPDAREMFALFVEQFEGRRIRYTPVAEHTVRLDAADAMEFLYTYNWGPESFPYEVREQYGVLTYEAYAAALRRWLPGCRLVPLPPGHASYLQDGYRTGLAGKVALAHADGTPAPLPDSNCLIVVEKPV